MVEDAAVTAAREADERGGDPRTIAFRGGNGARLRFDWQWSVGDLVKRFRVVFGLQAGAGTNARELADRLGGARDVLLNERPGDRLNAYLAAAGDHLHRRQREADDEAEKRARRRSFADVLGSYAGDGCSVRRARRSRRASILNMRRSFAWTEQSVSTTTGIV